MNETSRLENESDKKETLTGQEVADLTKEISEKFDLIAPKLLESNVVLTLSGIKPQTEFFIPITEEKNFESFAKEILQLNEYLKTQVPYIRFKLVAKPFISRTSNKLIQIVSIENLKGYERVSKKTRIQGITPFENTGDWDKLGSWIKENHERLEILYDEPATPQEIMTGLTKGYPDTAILDFADHWKNQHREEDLVDSNIPYTGTYQEAEPNYFFYKEHLNEQDIQENILESGKVLKEFYESDWHKRQINEE